MANREALRELQIRLASRLQAARSENLSVSSWLAVESAGQNYLMPLAQAGEIFPWTSVQAVPYTQDWVLGVAHLRGGLTGGVDLAPYYPDGAKPVIRGESINTATTYGYDSVTMMQETKTTVCQVERAA